MTTWADLVAVALVGTERREPSIDLDLLDGVDLGPPEAAVLVAAGVLATYRAAGAVPIRGRRTSEPAPADGRALAGDGAAQLLELVLGGDLRVPGGPAPLVAEWLDRCTRGGRRVPPRLVPAVLDAATADDDLRRHALGAVGPIASWLGARNPQWAWAAAAARTTGEDDGGAAWTEATTHERVAILAALRETAPGTARRLLESAWSTEPAATREAMLATLGTSLSTDDEPFLERALDDRARGVRSRAATLLDRLPQSRRAQRMTERLAPLVRVDGRLRKVLVVDLPPEPDDAARRDGVDDQRRDGLGVAASRLARIVSATPLGWWSSHLSRDVEWIVASGRERTELILGWGAAAVAQRDATWAATLLHHAPRPDLVAALASVDHSAAAATVRAQLARVEDKRVFAFVGALPPPWDAETSEAIVDRFVRMGASAAVELAAPVLARRLDTASAVTVERWASSLPEGTQVRRAARGVHHALTIRRSIAEELA